MIIKPVSTITAIKSQKNKNRVNVYLDDEFGFGIDLDNFVLLHLKIDQELTEKEVGEIVRKAEFRKTLDKLFKFVTLRPRSEKEIKDWFKRKKVHESLREELFGRLKRLELVDDKKFAEWWIGQRLSFRPKPKRIMIQELRIKGVNKEIVDEILGETKIDEEKMARQLLEKKAYKWKNLDKYKVRQKISQYLVGKGFGWTTIEKLVGEM